MLAPQHCQCPSNKFGVSPLLSDVKIRPKCAYEKHSVVWFSDAKKMCPIQMLMQIIEVYGNILNKAWVLRVSHTMFTVKSTPANILLWYWQTEIPDLGQIEENRYFPTICTYSWHLNQSRFSLKFKDIFLYDLWKKFTFWQNIKVSQIIVVITKKIIAALRFFGWNRQDSNKLLHHVVTGDETWEVLRLHNN